MIQKKVQYLIIVFAVILAVGVWFSACSQDKDKMPDNQDKTFEISKVDILYEDEAVTEVTKEYGAADFYFGLKVNNGVDISRFDKPTVTWTIVGDALGCKINNGVFTLGDTLGSVKINATVRSKTESSTEITVNIVKKQNSVLQNIVVAGLPVKTSYIEGQLFDTAGAVVMAQYTLNGENYSAKVLGYTVNQTEPLTPNISQVEFSYTDGSTARNTAIPIVVAHKTLQNIAITKAPNKTEYIEGELFDPAGMEVTAYYEFINEKISDYEIQNKNIALTSQTTDMIIAFGDPVLTATQNISVVSQTLQSILLDYENVIKIYTQGQRFNPKGLVVTAHYDFKDVVVTAYTYTSKKLELGDTSVTISYTENGITRIADIPITVEVPYSPLTIKTVRFPDAPADAILTWIFSYSDEDGEQVIDYETHDEQDLVYDTVNGIYEIPTGSIVTLTAISPDIIDFYIGGVKAGIHSTAQSYSFELGTVDVNVTYERIVASRITIRFSGLAQAIYQYPLNWNAALSDDDLQDIAFKFDEGNANYVNTYYIENALIGDYAALCAYVFSADTIVTVAREEVDNTFTVRLIYCENEEEDWEIDSNLEVLSQLPIPYQPGFEFVEWEKISGNVYKAVWESLFDEVNYTQDFVGEWVMELPTETSTVITCRYELKSNGTFVYTVINGETTRQANGVYRIDTESPDSLVVKHVEPSQGFSVNTNDFIFDISGCSDGSLAAVMFVVDTEHQSVLIIDDGAFVKIGGTI